MELPYLILLILFSLFLFLVLVYLLVGLILQVKVTYPIRYETNFTHQVDVDKGLIGDFDNLERHPYEIKLSDNYIIHSDYVLNPNNSKKFVIIVHGYTWTKEGSIKYARLFYKLGYSVIFYDTRGHGLNKHDQVTMGYKEARDLHEIILDTYNRFGNDITLGLHGESLGAATCLLTTTYQDKLDFIVSDCAFADLGNLLKYQAKKNHILSIFLEPSFLFFKLNVGYNPKDIKPMVSIQNNLTPLLIIHGDSDTFIPKEHAQMIYDNATKCYREIHYFVGAEHSSSIIVDINKYQSILSSFLNKVENGGKENGTK